MARRWPIHPLPYSDESLSSWLERLAHAYGYRSEDLLIYDLGSESMSSGELDINPPQRLLRELSERTDVPFDQIRAMTVQGWVPLLIDGLDPNPSRFPTYVGGHSLLYPVALRPLHAFKGWTPWLSMPPSQSMQICRICLQEKPEPYRRLTWRMAWMTTCPTHGVMLDDIYSPTGEDVSSIIGKPSPAPPELLALDHLTAQAVEKGSVSLPHREVHGGVWLRLQGSNRRAELTGFSVATVSTKYCTGME